MPACWKAHITRPEQSNALGPGGAPRVGRADPGQRGLDTAMRASPPSRRRRRPRAGRRRRGGMPPGGAASTAGPRPAAAAGGGAAGGGGHRRHGGKRLALAGGQRLVLRLDDGDLHLQLALLGLQVGAHGGGLLGGGLGVGGGLGGRRLGARRPASLAVRKFFICTDISVAITRCTASWSMRRCGESAVSIASRPSVRPPMYCAAAILSTDALERCQLRLGRVDRGQVGGVLLLRRPVAPPAFVEIELRASASPRWSARPAATAR